MYRGPRRLTLHLAGALLLTGALLTLLVANDVPRLLSTTYPVALVGVAVILDRVRKIGATLAAAYTGIGMLATFPSILTRRYTEGMAELDEWYLELAPMVISYQLAGLLLYLWLIRRVAWRPT